MPQSLARLPVHLVFSTKSREPRIIDPVRDSLHPYMAAVLKNIGCVPVLIKSVEDHVHILFDLARTVSVSEAVEAIKKSSSKWIKTQGREFAGFAWQAGYGALAVSESNVATSVPVIVTTPPGALAVSESNVAAVCDYIVKQREHHRRKTFREEYRMFLERHGINFDERYVWD